MILKDIGTKLWKHIGTNQYFKIKLTFNVKKIAQDRNLPSPKPLRHAITIGYALLYRHRIITTSPVCEIASIVLHQKPIGVPRLLVDPRQKTISSGANKDMKNHSVSTSTWLHSIGVERNNFQSQTTHKRQTASILQIISQSDLEHFFGKPNIRLFPLSTGSQ